MPRKISAGKWFCRGKQFVSALSFTESTSVFSSPTELLQNASLKEICLFPTYLDFHLLELPILTNSGSNEDVRNLLILISKEIFPCSCGLLFRFLPQQKLFSLHEWLHIIKLYLCVSYNICCAKKR